LQIRIKVIKGIYLKVVIQISLRQRLISFGIWLAVVATFNKAMLIIVISTSAFECLILYSAVFSKGHILTLETYLLEMVIHFEATLEFFGNRAHLKIDTKQL